MTKEERYKEVYQYYLTFMTEEGDPPNNSQTGRYFGFTREYARQILEEMVKKGYMIKTNKKRAKFYPNWIEKPKFVKNGKRLN
jgi:hypothetical protein